MRNTYDNDSRTKTYDITSDESTTEFVNFIYGDDYMSNDHKRSTVLEFIHEVGGVYVNTDNKGYILVRPGSFIQKINDDHFNLVEE